MPIALGPNGAVYQASIETEPCEGGFKATVCRVIFLMPASAIGTEVQHEPFPAHFAKSKHRAEHAAAAHFNLWAKLQRLDSKR